MPSDGSWSGMYASEPSSSSIRYPTVGPWCATLRACTVADPIVTGSSVASWYVSVHGTSPSRTGNSGGDM